VTRIALLAIALAGIAACTSQPPAPAEAERDPLTLGNAAWCGSNPPSGYCSMPEKR